MAIEVNGVSLPDIPEGVLETYPYAVINHIIAFLNGEVFADYYVLSCTSSPVFYVAQANMMVSLTEGYYTYDYSTTEEGWRDLGEVSDSSFEIALETSGSGGGTTAAELVWANHDILSATGEDSEGNVVSDGIYFLKSVTFEEEYSAPSTWFEGMADGIRKLTGAVKRYTTDEMLNALENPPQAASMTISNFLSGGGGVYLVNLMGIKIANLEDGKKYKVEIDGKVCECTAVVSSGTAMIGNMYLVTDTAANTGEPIMIMVTDNDGGTSSIYTNVSSDASHTISIMEMPSEST